MNGIDSSLLCSNKPLELTRDVGFRVKWPQCGDMNRMTELQRYYKKEAGIVRNVVLVASNY